MKGYLYNVITGEEIKGDEDFYVEPFTSILLESYDQPHSQQIIQSSEIGIKQGRRNKVISKSCLLLSSH